MAGRIADDVANYAGLRIDAFKLDAVEKLSLVFSNAFGVVMCIVLGSIGLLFFTGIATWLLGALLGSLLWASVIMGSLFVAAAVVVLVNRQRMFADQMVALFSRMLFNSKDGRES